jgi:PBSX family phage terminase large subunit
MSEGFQWGSFSRKQLFSIYDSDARLNIWHGAVRSGKTISSIIRWLHFVENAPKGNLMMIGHTIDQLVGNIFDPIEQMIGAAEFQYKRGSREAMLFGRKIKFRSAYNQASEGKIRGATLAGAYGDELTLWPEDFFNQLRARLSVGGAKFFGTTNPAGPYHYLKAKYLDREHELNLKSYHFQLRDNPNLDEDYVRDLEAESTGLFAKRNILGLWVLAEGVVYDMFDPEVHVVDILPASFERYAVGIDYGTVNPCAFILLGLHKGVWYAIREYYHASREEGRQKTDQDYSIDLRSWLGGIRPASTDVDPSAASFLLQLRNDHHGSVYEANNEVLEGIQTVGMALADGRLKIHSSCKNLARELATYSWDPTAAKRGEDKPLKSQDHACDALRYVCQRVIKRGVYGAPVEMETQSYWSAFGGF